MTRLLDALVSATAHIHRVEADNTDRPATSEKLLMGLQQRIIESDEDRRSRLEDAWVKALTEHVFSSRLNVMTRRLGLRIFSSLVALPEGIG